LAEDFRDVFGWSDGEHISTVDASGVALAAVKGLQQQTQDHQRALEADVERLREELRVAQVRLDALARQLLTLTSNQSGAVVATALTAPIPE
jgi:hypothetical protein